MNPKALQKLGYGLYVVCSKKGNQFNGQIANTIFQVCSEPPVIAVAINRQNLTHEFIVQSKVFTGSILSQEAPLPFIGNFGFKSGRQIDKFKGVQYKLGETSVPIVLDHTLAYLEAKVLSQIEVGTHTVFLGEIVGGDVVKDGDPMTYAYYHHVKRGTTPKSAPSYVEESKKAVTGVGSPNTSATSVVISMTRKRVIPMEESRMERRSRRFLTVGPAPSVGPQRICLKNGRMKERA